MRLKKLIMVLVFAGLMIALMPASPARANTLYIVNTTDWLDDGSCNVTHCSLREAARLAEADRDHSHVTFSIPGSPPHIIRLMTPLPVFTNSVTINGMTQPGYAGVPLIVLDASLISGDVIRLEGNGGSAIRGLVITGYREESASGIHIRDGLEISIHGNYIGTDLTGSRLASGGSGITVEGDTEAIFIGLPPSYYGTLEGRNVIASRCFAVIIGSSLGVPSSRVWVTNNYIGVDVTGTRATSGVVCSSGRGSGILLWRANNLLIGGYEAGEGNVISGFLGSGIILAEGADGNVIVGNKIGTAADGISPIPNGYPGQPDSGSGINHNWTARNTVIGWPGAGNIIAYNLGNGIDLTLFGEAGGNLIQSNAIFGNTQLGINLGLDGVNPNDPGDLDINQNYPMVSWATAGSGHIEIMTRINSRPNQTYLVEFFANDSCDPSGHGEGQYYIGAQDIVTDNSGSGSIRQMLPSNRTGGYITATAINMDSNTSEFSACRPIQPRFCPTCLTGMLLNEIDVAIVDKQIPPANGQALIGQLKNIEAYLGKEDVPAAIKGLGQFTLDVQYLIDKKVLGSEPGMAWIDQAMLVIETLSGKPEK